MFSTLILFIVSICKIWKASSTFSLNILLSLQIIEFLFFWRLRKVKRILDLKSRHFWMWNVKDPHIIWMKQVLSKFKGDIHCIWPYLLVTKRCPFIIFDSCISSHCNILLHRLVLLWNTCDWVNVKNNNTLWILFHLVDCIDDYFRGSSIIWNVILIEKVGINQLNAVCFKIACREDNNKLQPAFF